MYAARRAGRERLLERHLERLLGRQLRGEREILLCVG